MSGVQRHVSNVNICLLRFKEQRTTITRHLLFNEFEQSAKEMSINITMKKKKKKLATSERIDF